MQVQNMTHLKETVANMSLIIFRVIQDGGVTFVLPEAPSTVPTGEMGVRWCIFVPIAVHKQTCVT